MGKRPKLLLKGAAVHVPTGISLFFIPVRGREFAENGKRHMILLARMLDAG